MNTWMNWKRIQDKMNILYALPAIFLVMLASIEFDCWMMGIKPPAQRFFEYFENKTKK